MSENVRPTVSQRATQIAGGFSRAASQAQVFLINHPLAGGLIAGGVLAWFLLRRRQRKVVLV